MFHPIAGLAFAFGLLALAWRLGGKDSEAQSAEAPWPPAPETVQWPGPRDEEMLLALGLPPESWTPRRLILSQPEESHESSAIHARIQG